MTVVTLYSKPGCHLCEEARAIIEPLIGEFGATFCEVNIAEDGELMKRYGYDIPVIYVGERKVAKHRVNAEQFRRRLEEAVPRSGGF
jgi:glutaredoxin